ncbi:MAG: SUMF1/EgtB/PvdO family nonheme iron enzyme [Treponema sp.]|nr:SUMF1/EgtB/PvdO family nonheme iron enzyme [Treponema sp.]
MNKTLLFVLILTIGYVLFAQQNVSAPQKYALVIGNSNYSGISTLTNPVNDANDMETALKDLGFTVDKVLNGNLEQIENAVLNLKRRLSGSRNTYGFFFYAGHGVQSNGENYLIPVTADNIRSENQLRDRAVSLQFVLDTMSEAGNELNMIVLDACRDNPFGWARSGSRGLTVVSRAPGGSIVMYATGANSTAADGTGRNGLFTSHLLTNLKTPGLSVYEVFDRTMGSVTNATNGIQHPELSLRFAGANSAYLGSRASPSPSPTPQPNPSPSPNPSAIPANMVRINGGTFQMGSASGGESDERPVRQVTVSSFYMSIYEVTQKEWFEIMGTTVRQQRDMGYRAWSLHGEGDNYPMYYVNWYEAIEYCNKRSLKEGLTPVYGGSGNNITCSWNANGYRLPTEAEWEYAAKGGGRDPLIYTYSGSNNASTVAWYTDNSGNSTHPAGTKTPNSLGLYDMSGNVGEWCWDWRGSYPQGAQTDPRGASSGTNRVIRGGGFGHSEDVIRSARRLGTYPEVWDGRTGFRVVRSQ